ncbi:DUF2059 domain-containing protein [Undibacterium sp. SXout7W]|uniref:DUF2059 domain-containing protein n=1 Tax=Undibacterium sp. SXout7W TaxID=3413049 RepID=UPI003BF1DD1F
MKLWHALLLIGTLLANGAEAAKPTEESLKTLFAAANSKSLIRNMEGQLDQILKNAQQTVSKGQPVSKEKQEVLDHFRDKLIVIYKQEMSWEHMEPALIEIYNNSLSQEDVDGITAFYQSPAGQAYVQKMPVVMQQTMSVMQKKMEPIMEKIMVISKELQTELLEIDKKTQKNKPE